MRTFLLVVACVGASLGIVSTATAGPNAGGALVLHAQEQIVYSAGAEYCDAAEVGACAELRTETSGTGITVVHVLASFPPDAAPRMVGVTFGVVYDEDDLTVLEADACGDFHISGPSWPQPFTGIAMTWNTPQTELISPVCWLAVQHTTLAAATLSIIDHPSQDAIFADDSVPSVFDPVECFGSFGFNTTGASCCAVTSVDEHPSSVSNFGVLSVAPNPCEQSSLITFKPEASGPVMVEVISVAGRRLGGREISVASPGTVQSLRLIDVLGGHPLPAGKYVLRVSQGGAMTSQSIAVVR